MKKLFFLLPLSLVLLVPSTLPAQSGKGSAKSEVIILHVNDMHAKIDNLGKLAYLADSLKRGHPYVFLVAAGDNFTGNPVVDMVADKGYPQIDLMNRCGFTVSAFGNHEFDMGQDFLAKRIRQAKFPFICANFNVGGAIIKQPKPYIILKAGKNRIPVVAAIELNENGLPDTHPSRVKGIVFFNGITTLKNYWYLKSDYGNLLALTHLGVETDERLADSMPSLDLIIGGHSHTLIDKPLVQNGVRIVQAGANLKYVGKTTLLLENGHILSIRDTLICMDSLRRADPKIQELIKKYNDNDELNRVVATAATPFSNKEELGCMMTDALVASLNLDLAFQNWGGVRVNEMAQGNITVKDIYKLDPFGNQVVTYKMTAAEIRSLVCNAFNLTKSVDLFISGGSYTILTGEDNQCTGVKILDKNGKTLDEKQLYVVGMNSYIAAAYKFDHSDPGTTLYSTTATLLIEWLEKAKTVNYQGVSRTAVAHGMK